MGRWVKVGMALAIASLAAPAAAQIQGSEGEKFLKAVEEGDSDAEADNAAE